MVAKWGERSLRTTTLSDPFIAKVDVPCVGGAPSAPRPAKTLFAFVAPNGSDELGWVNATGK